MISAQSLARWFHWKHKKGRMRRHRQLKILPAQTVSRANKAPRPQAAAVLLCRAYYCVCGVFHTTDELCVRKKGQNFFGPAAFHEVT
jgi:hypothetical protein